MTLNQLIYFQKVATLENYHQAAEVLYVSQPSLSRSMAALETELGITLFKKDGRGVVLTKAGHLFLEHANKIIADCDVAVDKMQELSSNGGEIDIGYVFHWLGTIYIIRYGVSLKIRKIQRLCLISGRIIPLPSLKK